jgi:hypothetical protein
MVEPTGTQFDTSTAGGTPYHEDGLIAIIQSRLCESYKARCVF